MGKSPRAQDKAAAVMAFQGGDSQTSKKYHFIVWPRAGPQGIEMHPGSFLQQYNFQNTVVKTVNSTESFMGCEASTDSSSLSSSQDKIEVKQTLLTVIIKAI